MQLSKSNNLREPALRKFMRNFAQKCAEMGTNELELTYAELAEITGLSRASAFKAIEILVRRGQIEKRSSGSRRFPNRYILKGPIEIEEEGSIESFMFKDGKEFVRSFGEMRTELAERIQEIEELKEEVENLKALVGEHEIISRVELPGDLIQITFRKK